MEVLEQVKKKIYEFIEVCNYPKALELLEKLSTGKMLRSKLILKIAGISEDSIKLCAVVEMIHAASLLHDDVIDEADTRRGKPSINALYSDKTSIMFGDILYSRAFTELSQMDKRVAYHISNTVTELSIGEMMDVDLTLTFNTSYDKYLTMIYKKTASLIEASARSAAILAGLNSDKYALYGKNLGLAFQMIDDILDITSDSKTLGKPAMLDFVEGKVTIPYLYLYERVEEKDYLKSLYKKELNKEELNWIKTKFKETNALNDSINEARKIGLEAINSIKDEKNSKDLVDIMKDMIEREF
ncbi:Octaprenyl-diphosphate synthase [Aliarcobacter thereius]|uniref:Octaprenyl-diphosphate synthase n=1 Tax=Aliarcobacter thereius LMG 24486 TaxID=1032240 RepID=A0A1C7WNL9_9BACT|nr:polyprenyl synthetase family protein [Aliarcobacter thereius]OCL87705.1 Octaprenyl-diphosphate synthase [Aliarcobacter thereius]OCL95356.1 Octaprenyl-diphosphate synthase [Aliarcobacter thereius LMG 24486]QBF16655.1 octaprenyl-diphosphate synthase [Aliarcobacter thereius LMG 24486]TLS93620.1 polyprenyl synthetase family protein [Aliarcobacter thereius]TLT08538.1 polyprenyl synthetase family protein [Aliarcobacter thereius]